MFRVSQRRSGPPSASPRLPPPPPRFHRRCSAASLRRTRRQHRDRAAPPGQTGGAVSGTLTSHRCLRRGSCASQHGSEIAFSFLSCPTAEGPQPFPEPSCGSGAGTDSPEPALNQPGPEWGLLLSCFPPGHGSEAHEGFGSTTLEISFLLQSGAKAFAGHPQCPGCQACGKSPDVPSVPQVALALHQGCQSTMSHNAQAAPPSFARAGDRSSSGHSGLAATLGPEVRHRGLQLRQSHGRSAGSRAGTREFRRCWFRAEHWREGSGHSRDTRSGGSVQDTLQPAAEPPPSPSSAGTAPPWQPLGSPGETAGPGLLQPFPILCKRVVIRTR